ncbi:MAG: NTPase [Haloplasmataceae bacterium]|jgi:inosine/xanthosine triphosphatase|nr:NTPase [Haloplasmataceae bacterium]
MFNLSKRVVVGSTNKVKVDAIKVLLPDNEVIGLNIQSRVSPQPMTDEETIKGALNRALGARRFGEIGIGLEGGVHQTSFGMFLVNFGVLVDEDFKVYLAGGTRILLPKEVSKEIYKGKELGTIMDDYSNRINVKHEEGAVGIFTNNLVKRQDIFEHIGKLLLGQYQTGNATVDINHLMEEE